MGYFGGIIILLCINSIAAMGVSLLTGFTGIFTLGHAAYMALGAYTTAILTVNTVSIGFGNFSWRSYFHDNSLSHRHTYP